MADWYISSAGYTAVTAWAATTAYSVGDIRRPTAATYGSERVYRCTTAGTSGGSEPAAVNGNPWNLSKGGTTTDGTVVWTEITGQSTYNWAAPFARVATITTQAAGPGFHALPVVSAGGTGYAVGDVLQVSNGTPHGDRPLYRVATISGSAVATATILSGGSMASSGTPATTTAITGGGSGATFTFAAQNYAIAAGDTYYVSHDHAESQASLMTLTNPGSASSPSRILCVNRAGSVPPVSADLATTATLTTTGNNNINMGSGVAYYDGLSFICGGTGASSLTASATSHYENCKFKLSGATGSMSFATTGIRFRLINTTLEFSNVANSVLTLGPVEWRDTPSAIVGTVPTTLFTSTDRGTNIVCEGVDLSAAGSGKTLVSSTLGGFIRFKDCKLGASVVVATTPASQGVGVDLIRCDSGATNYRTERYAFAGTLTTETTIVRSDGASDGTTPISWKIVTTANPEWFSPFEAYPISVWNETTGSPLTVTVEGVWGGGAVPLNDEIWMDVEYLGDALSPQGSFATTTKADILATGTNTTASSETWGGSTTPFKLAVSVTPQMKGPITVYVRAAKVSSIFYIDPKITLS